VETINFQQNEFYYLSKLLPKSHKKRIIVLGSGFAGISFVKAFVKNIGSKLDDVELVILTRRVYLTFTPLIYQIATGLLNEHHVLEPIRKRNSDYVIIEAEIEEINLHDKKVITSLGSIEYDYLIIALGSVSNDLGIKGAFNYAIPLKSVQDATKIRNKIIESFEKASILKKDDIKRKSLLTFVIIGGGATGVELAGSIKDYVNLLCKRYYNVNSNEAKVVLLEATDRLIYQASEKASKKCKQILEKSGIEIILNAKVISIEKNKILLSNGSVISSDNIFWTAGIKVNPIIEKIPNEVALKNKGRLVVDRNLKLIGYTDVFAIGDCAYIIDGETGQIVPPMASSAVQEGKYVAKYLANYFIGKQELNPFKFKDYGLMLSLGRFSGLVDFQNKFVISGFLGWVLWRMVHLLKISTIRNKLGIVFDWSMSLLKRRIITRTD
jgi:NADH dehydrogenase